MTRPTFTWNPDLAAELEMKPVVEVVRFGDGYESRTPIGLNSNPRKWSVKFTRGSNESAAIRQFLKGRNATESFYWTDPEGNLGVFVCRTWKASQIHFGVYQVTGVFEEVFEP